MNKKKIVPIAKGDPKIWVSFGTEAESLRSNNCFKKIMQSGALLIREYISIKMNLQAWAVLEFWKYTKMKGANSIIIDANKSGSGHA